MTSNHAPVTEASSSSAKIAKTPEANADEGRQAGRGGLAVLVAKVFFIGSGLVQQALLPRAIGKADYGALARVSAVTNVLNNVVVASSTQGVSRIVAAAGAHEREALRATLRIHVGIALVATGLLVASAPLAALFQHAPEVTAPIIVMAGVLAVYGVYAPLVGYINGRRLFARQATLDMLAATLRTGGVLGIGWLFAHRAQGLAASLGTMPGVLGTAVGSVLAALGVFLVALRWTGTGRGFTTRPEAVPVMRAYVGLVVPIMIAQLFVNGLMQADILVLGRYLSISAKGAATDPSAAANEWVAVYRACQLFAFLPYQMLFSVTQVLFPMLARARAEEGEARVAALVTRGSRIGAIICGILVAVVVAMPESLIKFAYDKDIAAQGAPVLRILALGQAAFAMLGLATTILVSLGRERSAMALSALALAALVAACFGFVPSASFGEAQLRASASGAAVALGVALVVGVIVVRRVAGAFVPLLTAIRVGGCVALAAAAGTYVPVVSKLLTPVLAIGVVIVFLVLLVVTRELKREDLALILSVGRAKR